MLSSSDIIYETGLFPHATFKSPQRFIVPNSRWNAYIVFMNYGMSELSVDRNFPSNHKHMVYIDRCVCVCVETGFISLYEVCIPPLTLSFKSNYKCVQLK